VNQKPFADPRRTFTIIDNVVLDRIMPELSPLGWKVLCVALRHCQGGNQQTGLSLRELVTRAGGQEVEATQRAVQECVQAGYLIRQATGSNPPSKAREVYTLNTAFDVAAVNERAYRALVEFGREMKAETDVGLIREAVCKNETDAVLNWIETGREMTNLPKPARFETVVQRLLEQVPPLPRELLMAMAAEEIARDRPPATPVRISPQPPPVTAEVLWQNTLAVLESRVRKSKLQWFKPTHGESLKKGTLVVSVPNQRTKEWLEEGQLAATVREAANSAAGKPLKLVFRVKT
jgi:hypothetical protein